MLCFASPLTGVGPTCSPDLQSDGFARESESGVLLPAPLAVAFGCPAQALSFPICPPLCEMGCHLFSASGNPDGATWEAVLPTEGALLISGGGPGKLARRPGHCALDSLAGEEEEGRGMWL